MVNSGHLIKKLASFHAGTILVGAAILWLTLAPHPIGDQEIPLFPGADKIVHALMFLGLCGIFLVEMQIIGKLRKSVAAVATICTILMGIGIEYLQRLMGLGRSFEAADMIADTTGALIAGIAALIFIYHSKTHTH